MREMAQDARRAFAENPADWKAARRRIDAKWRLVKKWNDNSVVVNGALVLLALFYGAGDFYRTLQLAMALGHDADCNAATAGAALGYRMGFRKLSRLPQFAMPDRYVNRTRPELPAECRVSEQAETMLRVSEKVILENGGRKERKGGQDGYRIRVQTPAMVEALPPGVRRPDPAD
jgi:hypothetical protein